MNQLKWWEASVDELVIGLAIAAIAVVALIYVPEQGVSVATAAIGALGGYIVGRSTKSPANGK